MDLPAVSRLNKQECIELLNALKLPFPGKATVPELRQILLDFKEEHKPLSKRLSAIAAMKKQEMQAEARSMGISLTGNETRASILLRCRNHLKTSRTIGLRS